jgi:hypothetical protein
MDIEEIDAQIQKYMRCLTFYGAMRSASKAHARADRHQKKLDKLLQVKREWF